MSQKLRSPGPVLLSVWLTAGFVVGFGSVTLLPALWKRPRPSLVATTVSLPSAKRVFQSDAGLIVKFVKPGKIADFEATIDALRKALSETDIVQRRDQAVTWRVFRAINPATNGDAVYVFEFDPVVPGADYAVAHILEEAFPSEAASLIGRYASSSDSQQHVLDMTLVAELGY